MFGISPRLGSNHRIIHRRLIDAGKNLLESGRPSTGCIQFLPTQKCDILPYRRHFSSDEGSDETNKSNQFPWRHQQKMLPRVELEMLSTKRGGWRSSLASIFWEKGTLLLMRRPFFEVIGNRWKQDLADHCAWAFTAGITELLSSTFRGKPCC